MIYMGVPTLKKVTPHNYFCIPRYYNLNPMTFIPIPIHFLYDPIHFMHSPHMKWNIYTRQYYCYFEFPRPTTIKHLLPHQSGLLPTI